MGEKKDVDQEGQRAIVLDLAEHRRRLSVIREPEQGSLDLIAPGYRPKLESDEVFYSPIFMFQTALPLRQLVPATESKTKRVKKDPLIHGAYVRTNGKIRMELRSIRSEMAYQLPYGKLPRIFLMWLANAVALHPECIDSQRRFKLRTSYRELCRQVGVDSSTGVRGSGRALLEQIIRVLNSQFTILSKETVIGADGSPKIVEQTRAFTVSSNMVLSWNARSQGPRQWLDSVDGYFQLSENFAEELSKRRMAVCAAHLPKVCDTNSGFRIDVYHWVLTQNYYLANKSATGIITVRWDELMGRFGGEWNQHEFVRCFRRELRWIHKELWPELNYNDASGKMLRLMRSALPYELPPRRALPRTF